MQELYSIETKAEIVRNATHLMKERIQEEHNREILYIKRKKEYLTKKRVGLMEDEEKVGRKTNASQMIYAEGM